MTRLDAGHATTLWQARSRAAWRLPLCFALVFFGADGLTASHSRRVVLNGAWEVAIPYWPGAWWPYASVLILPALCLALLPDAASVRRWEHRMLWAVAIGGLGFVLLPADLAYAPEPGTGLPAWAALVKWLAGTHNLFPSLHVALGLLCPQALWVVARSHRANLAVSVASRAGLAAWAALLVPAVLLTHQHHVVDAVGGLVLAFALVRWGPR
jgi:hypothetical protein